MRGVQVKLQEKLWDRLRTCAVPKRLGGVITARRYTNPRLPYLTFSSSRKWSLKWYDVQNMLLKTYHYRAAHRQRPVIDTFLLLVLLAGAFWRMRCSFHIPTCRVHLNVLMIGIQSLRLSCTIGRLKVCRVCRYIFWCVFSRLHTVAVMIQYCNMFDVCIYR